MKKQNILAHSGAPTRRAGLLAATLLLALGSGGAQAGLITLSGAGLLGQAGVVQPNGNWTVAGSSIQHALNNGGNLVLLRWDNVFGANLFSGGGEVKVRLDMTSLSGDQDPMIALADSSQLIGAGAFDQVHAFTGTGSHNGSTFTYDLQTGSGPNVALNNFILEGVFTIAASGQTTVRSNVTQGANNATLVENDSVSFNLSQPLSLLFLGQSSSESYQINSITLEGDMIGSAVPEPATALLLSLGGLLGLVRRRAA